MVVRLLAFLAVAPLAASPATAPSAAPSDALREIGHVRATVSCAVLREAVLPAMFGLQHNDDLIHAGHGDFASLARDEASASGIAMDRDMVYLGQVEARLTKNLAQLSAFLNDHAHFPADATPEAAPSPVPMREELRAAAAAQQQTLLFIDAILRNEALGKLQSSNAMESAITNATSPGTTSTIGNAHTTQTSFLGSAGLRDVISGPEIPLTIANAPTLAGHTFYDALVHAYEQHEAAVAHQEQAVTASVVDAVAECHRSQAQGVPATSPAP